MEKHICKTCIYAAWSDLSPTGRIARGAYGKCEYRIPAVPKNRIPECTEVVYRTVGICPDREHECPVYEPKPKGEPHKVINWERIKANIPS